MSSAHNQLESQYQNMVGRAFGDFEVEAHRHLEFAKDVKYLSLSRVLVGSPDFKLVIINHLLYSAVHIMLHMLHVSTPGRKPFSHYFMNAAMESESSFLKS